MATPEENTNLVNDSLVANGGGVILNGTKDPAIEDAAYFSDSDDDAFVDISGSNKPYIKTNDLLSSIEDSEKVLSMFFNNQFKESKNYLEPIANSSMYHSLVYSTILFLEATMTFETASIKLALDSLKETTNVCQQRRRKQTVMTSLQRIVHSPNYEAYTEEECHAELIYAETLLFRAVLTFVQDENMISFVKGGWKIRCCYMCYKECLKMLEKRQWQCGTLRDNFEAGVRLGIGSFNLFLSMMPPRLLRLLEFVGFSGNKEFGIDCLEKGRLAPSLRCLMCSAVLLGHHTFITVIVGNGDGDVDYAAEVLEPCYSKYPNGVFWLFYRGRILEVKGDIEEAIPVFLQSIEVQNEWRQIHHACYWELMWCHMFKLEWRKACHYIDFLVTESRWSKATYLYSKAALLDMCDEPTDKMTREVGETYDQVPKFKQRIAGKSLPIEKFVIGKCKKFVQQGKLLLPGIELMYIWNGFNILGRCPVLLSNVLELVEKSLVVLLKENDDSRCKDDVALLWLLKGMCLKYDPSKSNEAALCLAKAATYDKSLKYDTYITPHAMVEHALLCIDKNRMEEAKRYLDHAKKNFDHYALASRLHFRIHAAEKLLSRKLAGDPNVCVDSSFDRSG